jgi:hypothetical protein
MSSSIFNIEYKTLVEMLTPTFFRQKRYIKWLRVLIKPLSTQKSVFLKFRTESLYKLSHNSQVIYLEKVLNDAFDNDLRRIYINNAIIIEPIWFYEIEDNKPVLFYEIADNKPVYFREGAELTGDSIDFTVFVPSELQPSTTTAFENFINQMRALVDYYKLYSKNYQIQFYNE